MRSNIFIEWLNHLDYYFRTMDWKGLLFIDNAGSHFSLKRFEKNDDNNNNEKMSDNKRDSE